MKQLLTLCSLVILFGSIASCQSDKLPVCTDCRPLKPDGNKKLSISNAGATLNIDLKFWRTLASGDLTYYYSTYKEKQSTQKYDEINTFMASLVGGSAGAEFLAKNNYCFTLYIDGNISVDSTFNISKIMGFNIYHVANGYLDHKFFQKTEDGFVENKRLSVRVKGVDIFEIYKLSELYFKPTTKSVIAVNIGITDNSRANEFKYSDEVPENLKLSVAFDLSRQIVAKGGDDDFMKAFYKVAPSESAPCPSPCSSLPGFKFCEASFPSSEQSCKKMSGVQGDCFMARGATLIKNQTSSMVFSDTLKVAYSLRDNLLSLNARGKFYSDSYYYLSSLSFDSLNLSETTTLANIFITDGVPTLNAFMNNGSLVSTALYGDSVKAHALYAINLVKSKIHSTDTMGLQIMDWYATQINKYKDSSLTKIKADF